MIKEKCLNLVNACKNDRDMLDIIESDMRALGEYVYAVHMMETALPIIRINYEGQELRDRIEKLSIEDIAIMLKNLEEAKAFYKEFYKRRDEFI